MVSIIQLAQELSDGNNNDSDNDSDDDSDDDSDNDGEQSVNVQGENLINATNANSWKESKTDTLEQQLTEQIAIIKYHESGDVKCIEDELDTDDDDMLELMEDNEETKNKRNTERRPSNLFRYESKRSWGDYQLDEQEDELKRMMEALKTGTSQSQSPNT